MQHVVSWVVVCVMLGMTAAAILVLLHGGWVRKVRSAMEHIEFAEIAADGMEKELRRQEMEHAMRCVVGDEKTWKSRCKAGCRGCGHEMIAIGLLLGVLVLTWVIVFIETQP